MFDTIKELIEEQKYVQLKKEIIKEDDNISILNFGF